MYTKILVYTEPSTRILESETYRSPGEIVIFLSIDRSMSIYLSNNPSVYLGISQSVYLFYSFQTYAVQEKFFLPYISQDTKDYSKFIEPKIIDSVLVVTTMMTMTVITVLTCNNYQYEHYDIDKFKITSNVHKDKQSFNKSEKQKIHRVAQIYD